MQIKLLILSPLLTQMMRNGFNIFSKGTLSRVPPNFVFPIMTLCTLITSWFCGNESTKTIPLKLLRATEIKDKKERYKLSKKKSLMAVVKTEAEEVRDLAGSERFIRCGFYSVAL